ncbi:depolymerase [Duganella sp. CF402]|uniref:extracellular catalytic domain type 2 short-chain-length polyhydroxyalkanoate depolymerase n=1 Tax=unclassified Duganella TaxID=2636909 RepID=UPI0035A344A5
MMNLRSSLALLSLAFGCAHAASSLPGFAADPGGTSVSGLSSGAFMAVQYQVAYSSEVVGSGIVAGGPYYCAAGLVMNAGICMGSVPFVAPNPYLMVGAAQTYAGLNLIDPLSNLAKDRIYVFSGTKDTVVYQKAVDATVGFFKEAGVPAANLQYVNSLPAGHALITPSFGNPCPDNKSPYISHCALSARDYDQPAEILAHIYGPLNPRAVTRSGQLIAFKQSEFGTSAISMADEAYVYVPANCQQGGCKVHVAFHGCKQSAESVKDDFYNKSSYNDWADSNRLIVLYPQVNKSPVVPFNPEGCWDWFGYTGALYATKSGPQIQAIRAMIQRLTSPVSTQVASAQ